MGFGHLDVATQGRCVNERLYMFTCISLQPRSVLAVSLLLVSFTPVLLVVSFHYQPEAFYTDVEQAPWSVLDVFDDVNDKLFAFCELFCDIVDKHAPIKKIKIRGKYSLV